MGREVPGAKSVCIMNFATECVGSRQETVTARLRSHGTMYRKELVSKAGTRLS